CAVLNAEPGRLAEPGQRCPRLRETGTNMRPNARLVALLAVGLIVLPLAAVPSASAGARMQAAVPAPLGCNQSAGRCWKPSVKARCQYQLQGSPGTHGSCLFKSTGFINIGVTGTSFATGRTVAPTVFDIDILQDGKCYSPQDYS